MNNALQVIDGEIVIDPALVKISFGNLPLPENIECIFQEPYTFRLSWAISLPEGHEHDQVMVLAYHIEGRDEFGIVYCSYRNNGEQLVPLETLMARPFIFTWPLLLRTRAGSRIAFIWGSLRFDISPN